MNRLFILPVLFLFLLVGNPAISADFKKGIDATQKGDFETALEERKPLAELGITRAQINLGLMHFNGQGVPQDYKTAVKWFTRAAKQGDAIAQHNLSLMYDKGLGVTQHYKTAVKWYKLAAEYGFAPAQYNLGVMYDKGRGVTQDFKAAVKLYQLAAEQGDADAQFNLGVMYDKGEGVTQDDRSAVKWYKLSAEQGFADAQNNLGLKYDKGTGTPQDDTRAYMWWNIAASQGHRSARRNRDIAEKEMSPTQIETAQRLAREWLEKHGNKTSSANYQKGLKAVPIEDFATTLKELKPLAEQGDAVAQYKLGQIYRLGKGVPQDYKTAFKWYKLAAEQGIEQQMQGRVEQTEQKSTPSVTLEIPTKTTSTFSPAPEHECDRLAAYPSDNNKVGKGVFFSNLKADEAIRACTAAITKYPTEIRFNYQLGRSYTKKGANKKSLKFYTSAAEHGDARAQSNLGLMYEKGRGVTQDYKTAVKWYKLSAEQGYTYAMTILGLMYADGTGTIQDDTRAHMWWNIAASKGNKSARNNRDIVEKKMSPAQLETAQRLARECGEKNYKGC